jgi:hypothetical protein
MHRKLLGFLGWLDVLADRVVHTFEIRRELQQLGIFDQLFNKLVNVLGLPLLRSRRSLQKLAELDLRIHP